MESQMRLLIGVLIKGRWRVDQGMALRRTVASIGTKKLFPIKRITDRVKALSTSAVMAKLSLSPLCVQADTRRFAFRTF